MSPLNTKILIILTGGGCISDPSLGKVCLPCGGPGQSCCDQSTQGPVCTISYFRCINDIRVDPSTVTPTGDTLPFKWIGNAPAGTLFFISTGTTGVNSKNILEQEVGSNAYSIPLNNVPLKASTLHIRPAWRVPNQDALYHQDVTYSLR